MSKPAVDLGGRALTSGDDGGAVTLGGSGPRLAEFFAESFVGKPFGIFGSGTWGFTCCTGNGEAAPSFGEHGGFEHAIFELSFCDSESTVGNFSNDSLFDGFAFSSPLTGFSVDL